MAEHRTHSIRDAWSRRVIGQIGLVSGDGAAMPLSSARRPHGDAKLVRETPWNHRGRHDSTFLKNCR
jgi:hypothetical protein